MPTAILDVDIQHIPGEISGLHGYDQALVLVRFDGRPVGKTWISVEEGRISGSDLSQSVLEVGGWAVCEQMVDDWLGVDERQNAARPTVTATVAVCTRDRTEDLQRCLDALMRLPDDGQEILVIDNAPSTDATERLVKGYARVRYVREDRPGLDCARNRALSEARHEVVAFTDDDSVPDPNWLRAILRAFSDPLVMCVTGLTLPLELETEAQEWFERVSTFDRGFRGRVFDLTNHNPLAAGAVGAGVNMALRRDVVQHVGFFAEELDAGTLTQSGGDHEMFTRILLNGYRIAYEPCALNFHRHRRTWESLRKTLYGYGVGVYATLTHHLLVHGEWGVVRIAWGWFWYSQFRNLVRSLLGRSRAFPLSLVLAELRGCLKGPTAYFQSRRKLSSSYSVRS